MDTLKDLQSGKLQGVKTLKLSESLLEFPEEIFSLAESLEVLDMSDNLLSALPDLSALTKLKIAFFSFNRLREVPSAFKGCDQLFMLGLKGNQIVRFDEDILPLSISWLILTDNALTQLPRSIGKLTKMRKFPLAGNQLRTLPDEMSAMKALELTRLSANQLTTIPEWLLHLPKLSWLAFSGNPCAEVRVPELQEVAYESLEMSELLGEGASGQIYKGYDKEAENEVAVKLFKGAITSDGYAHDEMSAYMSTGEHPHLISVHAKIKGSEPLGLVLELIPSHYENLGLAPSFETCTRDTFKEDTDFEVETIFSVARAMVSAAEHLHERGIMHGDLYAHNILINREDEHCYFGDFGAATFYERSNPLFEKIEVRAFGCLLEDMLMYCSQRERDGYHYLRDLATTCMDDNVAKRPRFKDIVL